LSKSQVVENLVAPLRSPLEFDEAFEKLRTECWYLHLKENDAWDFSKNENQRQSLPTKPPFLHFSSISSATHCVSCAALSSK
jgi:hypothetical protein